MEDLFFPVDAKCPDAPQGLPEPQIPHHKREGWREVLSKIYNLHSYVFMRLSERQLCIYCISLAFLGSCSSHWMLWGHSLNGTFKAWTTKCLYSESTSLETLWWIVRPSGGVAAGDLCAAFEAISQPTILASYSIQKKIIHNKKFCSTEGTAAN